MEGTVLSLRFVKSVIFCSITNVFRDFIYVYFIFTRFLSTGLRYIAHDELFVEDEEEEDDETQPPPPSHCERELSVEDAKAVIERLGMGEWGEEERWREGLDELLEEKEASLEELKEAFYVFDRNEDGFITRAELWSVMRRLGMKDCVRMEDCVRMVNAFDEDGDGRISFLEFKRLLENAI